jgi:regulatory protein
MDIQLKSAPKYGALIFTVIIDGDIFLEIHSKIFGKNPKFDSKDNLSAFKEAFLEEEYKKAKKYTLDRLSLRSYPTAELVALLEKNLVSSETIDKIINDCKRYGYLNDKEWIESFVKSETARGVGPQKILYKLRSKGIDANTAEMFLKDNSRDEDVITVLKKLLETKYKRFDLNNYKEKNKVINSLLRKGYSYDSINQVISND